MGRCIKSRLPPPALQHEQRDEKVEIFTSICYIFKIPHISTLFAIKKKARIA